MADESSYSRVQPPHTSSEATYQAQISSTSGFDASPAASSGYSCTYPALVPGLVPVQNQEQMYQGPGIYAVPVHQNMGPIIGVSLNNLIPLTYNVPTGPSASEVRQPDQEHRPVGPEQPPQPAQAAPQRQVVRFQIAFQIDLFLILKLAAVIFLFHQDGSRQRFALLVFCAAVVYLYQTGALRPLIRWLSQGMERGAAPPRPPRHGGRADNDPAPPRQGNENGDAAGGGAGNEEIRAGNDGNQAAAGNENRAGGGGNQWWGLVKEIQMVLFGFITSLLPGFHNHLD